VVDGRCCLIKTRHSSDLHQKMSRDVKKWGSVCVTTKMRRERLRVLNHGIPCRKEPPTIHFSTLVLVDIISSDILATLTTNRQALQAHCYLASPYFASSFNPYANSLGLLQTHVFNAMLIQLLFNLVIS
jgi:hypothetical protein